MGKKLIHTNSNNVKLGTPEKFDRNSVIFMLKKENPKMSFDKIATIIARQFNEPKMTRSRVFSIYTTYIRLKKYNQVKKFRKAGDFR